MEKVRVALVTDRRPGHEKQSRGVVQALRRYLRVDLTECAVTRPSPAQNLLFFARYWCGSSLGGVDVDGCDLVIGSGSSTHLPILALARQHQARSVICMTPPWPLRDRFDLCLSPIHDRVRPAANIFSTIGPPTSSQATDTHDSTKGLICIGGSDPASHVWNEKRIVADVKSLIKRSRQILSWTLASSPRTPKSTEYLLDMLAQETAEVRFVPFSQTEPGWIEQQYRQHQVVWITADSISMVYEALSSGCRVGLIPVAWRKKNSKFRYSEAYLVSRRLIMPLSAQLDDTGTWEKRQPLDEADRCAREIVKRWWPNNLR